MNLAESDRLTIFHRFHDVDSQTSIKLLMIALGVSIDFASAWFRFIERMVISVGSVTKGGPDGRLLIVAASIFRTDEFEFFGGHHDRMVKEVARLERDFRG